MPGATHRNGTPAALTAQRRARAVELAVQGLSFAAIGEQLDCDASTAWRAVTGALREHVPENVEELRRLEGARLDALQVALWPQAMAGDAAAVRAVVRICERRARLFGLDAPLQVEVVDDRVEEQLGELRAALTEPAPVLQLLPTAGD